MKGKKSGNGEVATNQGDDNFLTKLDSTRGSK
jgi:hypothetical protein